MNSHLIRFLLIGSCLVSINCGSSGKQPVVPSNLSAAQGGTYNPFCSNPGKSVATSECLSEACGSLGYCSCTQDETQNGNCLLGSCQKVGSCSGFICASDADCIALGLDPSKDPCDFSGNQFACIPTLSGFCKIENEDQDCQTLRGDRFHCASTAAYQSSSDARTVAVCPAGSSSCNICQAPVGTACSQNSDCGSWACGDGICSQTSFCSTDKDCTANPLGKTCSGETALCTSNSGTECTSGTQCTSGICKGGKCLATLNTACGSDKDCAVGKCLPLGFCDGSKDSCTQDSDCVTGAGARKCIGKLEDNLNFPTYCVPRLGSQCRSTGDCITLSGSTALVCAPTIYYYGINPPSSSAPTVCNDGTSNCWTCKTLLNGACTVNSDCSTWNCGAGGTCSYSNFCFADSDCNPISASGNICGINKQCGRR